MKLNIKKIKSILYEQLLYKKVASKLLAKHFNCKESELFYLYQKNQLPQTGHLSKDIHYFFHGLECSMKNDKEGWNITLDFGPKGNTLAFDMGTLCYELSIDMRNCDHFIQILLQNNVIKLADEKLYNLLKDNPNFNDWHSEEEEIDAMVADRFILIED